MVEWYVTGQGVGYYKDGNFYEDFSNVKKESEMGIHGLKDSDDKAVMRAVPRTLGNSLDNSKPLLPAEDQIDMLLKDRGSKYGSFDNHAKLTCALSDVFFAHMQHYNKAQYDTLTDSEKEALHMIFHKLGRIGNGDPHYPDSWVDIAGYAKLAADNIQKDLDFKSSNTRLDRE